jgi:Protein of unknown function (DUF2752)
VPPPLTSSADDRAGTAPAPSLTGSVRIVLVVTLVGLVAMFVVARLLDPYDAEGRPRQLGTHEQLGLPPCSFKVMTGKPCPSCGMTTSIALLTRGDVRPALHANWVGALLAVFGVLVVPWAAFCLARNRLVGVRSLEPAVTWVLVTFLVLALARWGLVLALHQY